jgi:hypothetical protein
VYDSVATQHQIDRVKYFTAHVKALPSSPDAPRRQQVYLRALRTVAKLEIVYGHFLSHRVRVRKRVERSFPRFGIPKAWKCWWVVISTFRQFSKRGSDARNGGRTRFARCPSLSLSPVLHVSPSPYLRVSLSLNRFPTPYSSLLTPHVQNSSPFTPYDSRLKILLSDLGHTDKLLSNFILYPFALTLFGSETRAPLFT